MAQEKRGTPFNGTQMKFAKTPGTPTTAITKLSNANPAVATVASHGLKNGDVVLLASVDNPAVNGLYVAAQTATATEFTVVGLDGSGLGTVGDAKFIKVDAFGFCDATSLDVEAATVDYEDMTTNCDDYPYEEGNIKAGAIQMEISYDPDKDVNQFLENLLFNQADTVFQFKPKAKKSMRSFVCSVSSFKFNGQANGKYKASLNLKIKSRPMDVAIGA